jgi:transcriptional regulator with XRE-family HTH domain
MERVGEKLRRRREELGFTIEDISKATKYRPEVIQAIEEGRTGVFPAEAYRQAFLRAYANKLGLDPAEIVRDQKSEEERVQEALKGIRLTPRAEPRFRKLLVWLVVIVAVAAAIILVYDRVIRVRGLREPAGQAEGLGLGGAESTHVAPSDSQAVAVPSDSAAIDSVRVGHPEMDGGKRDDAGRQDGEDSSGKPSGGEMQAGPVTRPSPELGGALGSEEKHGETEVVGAPGRLGGSDWLAVSVRGYAARAKLRAGDSILVDRWLRPDFSDTFYSSEPFWADTIITHENSILLVLNGEKVALPSAKDDVITDFKISP